MPKVRNWEEHYEDLNDDGVDDAEANETMDRMACDDEYLDALSSDKEEYFDDCGDEYLDDNRYFDDSAESFLGDNTEGGDEHLDEDMQELRDMEFEREWFGIEEERHDPMAPTPEEEAEWFEQDLKNMRIGEDG